MSAHAPEERPFRLDDPHDPLRTLRGRLTLPHAARSGERKLAYVLVLHGFKGFMDWGFFPELARALASRGLAVVRFNFSGSGVGADPFAFTEERAFFENTPTRELEDVERVRAWLAAEVPEIDAARGALLGHSLGGALALLHAARHADYRAVVGWASVANFRRFPSEVEALWRRHGFVEIPNVRTREIHRLGIGWLEDIERNADALDVPRACARLRTPTLLFHGSADEAVPLEEGHALLSSFAPGVARLVTLPGAGHTFGATHPFHGASTAFVQVLAASVDFMARALAPAGALTDG